MPKAQPEYTSGSMPQPSSTLGWTMPAPSTSIQPSPLQVGQPYAAALVALDVHLAARLGEREVVRDGSA